MKGTALLTAALLAPAMAAAAAGPLQVTSQVLVEQRVAAPDGSTRLQLVPPRKVTPGDRVAFAVQYRNTSDQPLGNVVLANPVPRDMAFRAAAPGSPAPELSVDEVHWGALASLTFRGANGAPRAATADDVTAVRWRLAAPIAPHGAGRLAFLAELK